MRRTYFGKAKTEREKDTMTTTSRMLQTSRDTQHYKSTLAGKQRIGLSLRPSSRGDILQIRLRRDRETRTRPLDSRSSRKIRVRDESRRKWLKFRRLYPTIASLWMLLR